jgi:hypothetical protein
MHVGKLDLRSVLFVNFKRKNGRRMNLNMREILNPRESKVFGNRKFSYMQTIVLKL